MIIYKFAFIARTSHMNSYILGPLTYSPSLFGWLASISNVVYPKQTSSHPIIKTKQTSSPPIVGNVNTILQVVQANSLRLILNSSSSPIPTFNIRIAYKLYLQNLS